MKTKTKIISVFLVLLVSAIILASCKPQANPSATSESQIQPALKAQDIAVTAADTSRPWYAERLEKLGFVVFPKAGDLPEFTVSAMNGSVASIKDQSGKVVLLNFWATWCPPCRSEMPSMQVLYDKTRDVPFTLFAISTNEKKETVEKFLKENKYTYPMYLDQSGTVGAQLASRGIPTTYILDKQGRAIAAIIGSRMYDGPEVIKLMRELAEKLP